MMMPIVMLIVILVVLRLVFIAEPFRRLWWYRGELPGSSHPDTALEILEWRYAKGEITRDQYSQMRADLEESRR
ncbi:MAG: SHOCT domain-containing protein [Gemmatimonadetes bacterium]|nr:SHOCT domain-containing protein [Gemmatimonadota bacterium]